MKNFSVHAWRFEVSWSTDSCNGFGLVNAKRWRMPGTSNKCNGGAASYVIYACLWGPLARHHAKHFLPSHQTYKRSKQLCDNIVYSLHNLNNLKSIVNIELT